ncbi:MAG: 50S ribosomal protein L10 [bacterium]
MTTENSEKTYRPEKQAILAEVREKVAGSSYVLITDYRGMKVEQFLDLRKKLRKAGAEVHVVKNSFARHVVTERGWTRLEACLAGQSAMVTGSEVTEVAKVLKAFMAGVNLPIAKGGMLGELYLDPAAVGVLAALPAREQLLGQVVGTVAAPLSRLVGTLHGKLCSLLYVLNAVEQKKQQLNAA